MKNINQPQEPFSVATALPDIFGNYPSFVVITKLPDATVSYLSPMVFHHCGCQAEDFYRKNRSFHKEMIHPEDYADYAVHLNSLRNLQEGEERSFNLRLKTTGPQQWVEYCFKDRLYRGNPHSQERTILSEVYRISDNLSRGTKDSCDDLELKIPSGAYKQLFNSIDEAFCIMEVLFDSHNTPIDYLFTEVNPAFEKQLPLRDAKGKTIRELIGTSEKGWLAIYGKVALSGIPIRFQKQAENLNKLWLDVYAFKLGDKNSRKIAVLFHDITSRKIAEKHLIKSKEYMELQVKNNQRELQQSNELLQAVFDSTNLAISVFRPIFDSHGTIEDFEFIRVNKLVTELYLKENPIGSRYTQSSPWGMEAGIFAAFKEVMRSGITLDREFLYDREGKYRWFRILAQKKEDLLISSSEEITSRKLEAKHLEEAVRFKKQLVQTSPDTIIIVNLPGYNIRYINNDLLKRAGMTKERILGMTLQDILLYVHPRDREELMRFHKRILKSHEDDIFDIEFRVKTRKTDWEWFSARGKIFNRKNEDWVEEYVLLVRNITAQKSTQSALINAEKLSIQGEVARTFAHELRNPLASIRMATDVLKMKLELPDKGPLEKYFHILSRSTKTLNNLVSNLLNASKYTPAQLKTVDLAQVLDQTIEQAADRIYLTGIKVKKYYKGPYLIQADKEKLKIAILNIVVNASEATNPDEGVIELRIKKHKTDYMLSITDNGHGLEQSQIAQLFDAFYTNKSSGLGIGLNSVKNILEEHDAKITVSSTPGVGTTFRILFPNPEIQ